MRTWRTHKPALRHSRRFRGSTAGVDEEYGRLMPSASIALAMVLAVYMPPHAPAPGHAFLTTSKRSASDMSSAAYAPVARDRTGFVERGFGPSAGWLKE